MANPLIMLLNFVDITGVTLDAWYDIDLDSHVTVPANAVDAIITVTNTSGQHQHGIRYNGSSDTIMGTMPSSGITTHVVHLDSGHVFEAYANNADPTFYLAGFTTGSCLCLNDRNRVDDDPGFTKNGTWQEIDANDHGVPAGADGIWVEFISPDGSAGTRSAGIRGNGSTDTFMYGWHSTYIATLCQWVPLDSSGIFELAMSSDMLSAWIVGYTVGLYETYLDWSGDNQVDYGQPADWSWQNVAITQCPVDQYSLGGIFHEYHYSGHNIRIRQEDSTDIISGITMIDGAPTLRVMGIKASTRGVQVYNYDQVVNKHYLAAVSVEAPPQEGGANYIRIAPLGLNLLRG